MTGLTEDLLNGVIREIEQNWERKGGNVDYFVGLVKNARLTPKDLERYLNEHGETCHEGVNNVFASVVLEDFLKNEEGGEA